MPNCFLIPFDTLPSNLTKALYSLNLWESILYGNNFANKPSSTKLGKVTFSCGFLSISR